MKSFKTLLLIVLSSSITIYFISCSDTQDSGFNPQVPVGTIQGSTKTPLGQSVPNSTVILESEASSPDNLPKDSTYSDVNGKYKFTNKPPGNYTLTCYKGSFKAGPFNIQLLNNQGTLVSDAVMMPKPPGKFAYLRGENDSLQQTLNSLGYTADPLDTTSFDNLSNLLPYTAIFLNCGRGAYNFNQQRVDNLSAYIGNGRTVYASNWAFKILERIYPGQLHGELKGAPDSTVMGANVLDNNLRNILGQTVDIRYKNTKSIVLNDATGQYVTPIIRGDIKDTAGNIWSNSILAFKIKHPSNPYGYLIYTNFHRHALSFQDMFTIIKFYIFEL